MQQILHVDIPAMRRILALEHKQIPQLYANINLPYDVEMFKNPCEGYLQSILADEYRTSTLFSDRTVDSAIKIFQ